MASGWAPDGAVQDQIDATVKDAVKRSRAALPQGEGPRECVECGTNIPEARRQAVPGVQFCVGCQSQFDEKAHIGSSFNRRGSKDSQLR